MVIFGYVLSTNTVGSVGQVVISTLAMVKLFGHHRYLQNIVYRPNPHTFGLMEVLGIFTCPGLVK